jgi:hypothetical protein
MLKIPPLPCPGLPPILKPLCILFPIKYISPTRNDVGANLISSWNQFTSATLVTGTKSCSIPKAICVSSNFSSKEMRRRSTLFWSHLSELTDDVLRGGGIRGQKKLPQYPQSLLCKDFFVEDVFCISVFVTLFNILFDFDLMCPFIPFWYTHCLYLC